MADCPFTARACADMEACKLGGCAKQLPAKIDALRQRVRGSHGMGVDDFRRHYDRELLAVLGVDSFHELHFPEGAP